MLSARVDPHEAVKRATANSFAYEWQHFGQLRSEWEQNFRGYLQPLEAEALADQLVLDVGAGSGRHSHHAALFGACVVAVDIGSAIDVARANCQAGSYASKRTPNACRSMTGPSTSCWRLASCTTCPTLHGRFEPSLATSAGRSVADLSVLGS